MDPIQLNQVEKKLYAKITEVINEYRSAVNGGRDSREKLWDSSTQLYQSLVARGVTPVFKKSLIQNRGCEPKEKEFFDNIQAAEHLKLFIDMPGFANGSHDITMNQTFILTVENRRYGSENEYVVTRIPDGWKIMLLNVQNCDRGGSPFLFETLANDDIQYPHNLNERMKWLWQKGDDGASPTEMQAAFFDLGSWVSEMEKMTPESGLWRDWLDQDARRNALLK